MSSAVNRYGRFTRGQFEGRHVNEIVSLHPKYIVFCYDRCQGHFGITREQYERAKVNQERAKLKQMIIPPAQAETPINIVRREDAVPGQGNTNFQIIGLDYGPELCPHASAPGGVPLRLTGETVVSIKGPDHPDFQRIAQAYGFEYPSPLEREVFLTGKWEAQAEPAEESVSFLDGLGSTVGSFLDGL